MINHIERICINCMKEKPEADGVCPHCGFNPKEYHPLPTQLPPFTILYGKYLLGRVVGQGGFGIVYIARDLVLDITVAIKELFPSNMVTRTITSETTSSTVSCTDDPKNLSLVREKFVREARTIARLQEHAGAGGIVQVRDLFEENNTAYLVMEYLQGETLKQYLEKYGNIECPQLLRMLRPVMESLNSIHKADIIHRDISPDNIMVMSTAESRQSGGTPLLKLLDFGNVKIQDASYDGSKSVIMAVKKGYSPIEQYSSEGQIGPWTDVYAMCATIYRCLTGKLPPEPTALAGGSITPPSQLGVKIPASTEKALMKGMALNFHERTQNMEELIAGLYENPRASAIAPGPSYAPAKKKKSFLPVILGGLCGILVLAGIIWYLGNREKKTENTRQTETSAIAALSQSEIQSEKKTEQPSEVQTEKKTEQPSEVQTEVKAQTPADTQTEMKTEKPSEAQTEVKAQTPAETQTEMKTETPAETQAPDQTEEKDVNPKETQKKESEESGQSEQIIPGETSVSEKETAETTPSDEDIAAPVISMIQALPEDISLQDETAVQEARQAFEDLTDDQKALVSSNDQEILSAAEADLSSLKKAESEALRQSESDREEADSVIQMIHDLPDEVSLDDEASVQTAQSSYNALTDAQKELVSSVSYEKLTDAANRLDTLKKEESEAARQSESDEEASRSVIQMIDDLPENVTLSDESLIQSVQESYDSLTDDQKDLISDDTYHKLLDAKAKLNDLQQVSKENEDEAQTVIDTINALPDYVTAGDEPIISDARSSYESLSEEAKSLVTNLSRLEKAEADLETAKQSVEQQPEWNTCRTYYAQKLNDTRTLYPIAPSANPFDGEVKGLCYATLAGYNGKSLPYLILCWRGDNDLAVSVEGVGKYYAYFYEICSWDGTQVVTSLASGTDPANAVNRYWISQIDGINYWVTWNLYGKRYDMIPLNSPGTRKTFYIDPTSGQFYVNGSVVDEDTYLQMCSLAEASTDDENVSMTRTTGYLDTVETAWYNPTSIEETYKKLTDSSLLPERSGSSWKTLYRNYLEKLKLHKKDTARIGLANLNDDDIPEMVIKQTSDELYYIIVTSDGTSLNIAMAPNGSLKGSERSNQFMLWGQPDDYSGFAYVLSIQDGAFHWDSHGCFNVAEIKEKKSNYMWDNIALSSLDEYNSIVSQQIPDGIDLVPENTYAEICAQLDTEY